MLSTAYLPPVSWMQAALKAEKVIIEAFETYPKQTYRNRCMIITANGVLPLSIPVTKVDGGKTKTKDIEIFYDDPWQRVHWLSIDMAYSNSPFYLYYKDELEKFYRKKFRFLLDYNMEILNTLFSLLGETTEISLTEVFLHSPEGILDLRNAISPKIDDVECNYRPYHQVFEEKHGFVEDLSIIDLLCNEGPGAGSVLNRE